jgi:hypothetical protein
VISTREPDSMTADERRLEISSILARGLLRRIQSSKTIESAASQKVSAGPQNGLDLSAKTRLSVAQRPAGYPPVAGRGISNYSD